MTPVLAPAALGGLVLSVCRLDDDSDMPRRSALALLSPAERERARRFCLDRDADRFVRARGHMRQELAAATGLDPAAIALENGRHGKPRMRSPSGLPCPQFNLSHSGGLAVFAISWDGPVGIDLELLDRDLDPTRIAPSVLVPSERQALNDLAAGTTLQHFLAMWTAKEARMKLTGEGMALDPRGITLALRGAWPTGYLSPAGPPVRLDYPDLQRPDAICAVARHETPVLRVAP